MPNSGRAGAIQSRLPRSASRPPSASPWGAAPLIVIAHRLTTVEACDRLIFLQDGRVAASGTYDELLRNATFRQMAAH
jgi:hypothetical protein